MTFSFLISSPMVDLGSLVLLMSIFGAKVAVVYVIAGLIIAIAGGILIEKLHMEKYVEEFRSLRERNACSILIPRQKRPSSRCSLISLWEWQSAPLFTTGSLQTGWKLFSAALIFGSVLPLAQKMESIPLLTAVFGLAGAVPILIFAFILAFAGRTLAALCRGTAKLEFWMQKAAGGIFLLLGIFFTLRQIFS